MKTITHINVKRDLILVRYEDEQFTVVKYDESIRKFDRVMTVIRDGNKENIFYSVSFIDEAEDSIGTQLYTLSHVQLVGLNVVEERVSTTEFDALSGGILGSPVESLRTHCIKVTLKRDDGYTTLHEVLE